MALGIGLVLIIWLVSDFYLSFQLAVGFAGIQEGIRFLLITLVGATGFCIVFFGMKKAQNY